jgi:hypothetical protein
MFCKLTSVKNTTCYIILRDVILVASVPFDHPVNPGGSMILYKDGGLVNLKENAEKVMQAVVRPCDRNPFLELIGDATNRVFLDYRMIRSVMGVPFDERPKPAVATCIAIDIPGGTKVLVQNSADDVIDKIRQTIGHTYGMRAHRCRTTRVSSNEPNFESVDKGTGCVPSPEQLGFDSKGEYGHHRPDSPNADAHDNDDELPADV